jgi:hypothetical protein
MPEVSSREPEITRELNILDEAIESLSMVSKMLDERFAPVLQELVPTGEAKEATEMPLVTTMIGKRIVASRSQIQRIGRELKHMADRVEV